MAESLKPCPFCGGEAKCEDWVDVHPIIDYVTGAYVDADVHYYERTGCPRCDIWFELPEGYEEGTTKVWWNRRA